MEVLCFCYLKVNFHFHIPVYLKTTPQTVWERMIKRGRTEESEVPLEYLEQVCFLVIYINIIK